MTDYNKEELKLVIQGLLAIFISCTLIRFLTLFSINFNAFATFGIILGATILYFSFRNSKEFDVFMSLTCFFAVPFTIVFSLFA